MHKIMDLKHLTPQDFSNLGRSVLYHPAFVFATLGMGLAFLPALLAKNDAVKGTIPYRWTKMALKLQSSLLSLNYEVKRHTPAPEGGAVYAVKHQSAWETLALWQIIDRPVFVLKKELLDIPVFGHYLGAADNIAIDRSAGKKAIEDMVEQARYYLLQGRNIVLFPEGTRTAIGSTPKYKSGIAAIYEAFSPAVYPVALNSGCFWPRNALIRKSGIVDVEILPPLPTGMSRHQFMETLQQHIETVTARLVAKPHYREGFEYS
jgi:1-acyl-sn-glycerol-3-phosphate acyltransferase